ncbi:525_t:CDS:2, partial [Acaulospora morrowiae]
LKEQLEQKEAIIDKYQKIIQSQNELLHDLTQKNQSISGSSNRRDVRDVDPGITSRRHGKQAQVNNCRAFVGAVTDDIDRESLRQSLEEAFGKVESIDIIPSKNCAFVDFTPISYHQAVSIGAVMVNGITLSVERVRKPKPRR